MKKTRHNQEHDSQEIPANWNNPFAGLKLQLAEAATPAPPPPKPAVPTGNATPSPRLSKEDQELLNAFSGEGDIPDTIPGKGAGRPRWRVSFGIQRKGKGGKTVTLVRGLEALDLLEQMDICTQVKTALGCGARFNNGILELQGDQRDRAQAWFDKHNANA